MEQFYTEGNSKYHQDLTSIIKGVHLKLRKCAHLLGDANKAWAEHLRDYDLREKYSIAMFKLATEVWRGKECRIGWAYQTCMNYFYKGGLEHSLKRQWKLENISLQKKYQNLSLQEKFVCSIELNNYKHLNRKLNLLDVGSCYNPFSKYKEFCCVAIDLTPATKDVYQCDFLELDVQPNPDSLFQHNCSYESLYFQESFDIVILSLVLEYLPSPYQRALFCYKSWQLLQENGLCVIITPDSKSINHNVHMIKSWHLALTKMGFVRVKYEKLQHIHCMAFRKIKQEPNSANENIKLDSISDLFFIPQDLKKYDEKETISERTEEENNDVCNNFLELPYEDLF